jgi:K+-sensing histidine kinase KdpD
VSTSTIPIVPSVEAPGRRTLTPAARARVVTIVALVVAVVGPFAAAAALVPVRDDIDSANAALALVVVVIGVAATARRTAAAVAAVSAALAFDYVFTVPFNSFTVRSSDDVETMALLLAVGLGVGQVAVVGRRYAALAARRATDLARIRRVTRLVAAGASVFEVLGAVQAELMTLFHLRSCAVEAVREPTHRPFVSAEGQLVHGQVLWGTGTLGLPGPEVELPAGTVRFVLVPTPGELVAPDRLEVGVALAELASASVAASR